MSDTRRPREVSRLKLPDGDVPHWLARSDDGRRVLVTGFSGLARRLVVLTFDPAMGVLRFDDRLGDGGARGVSFDRQGVAAWGNRRGDPARSSLQQR